MTPLPISRCLNTTLTISAEYLELDHLLELQRIADSEQREVLILAGLEIPVERNREDKGLVIQTEALSQRQLITAGWDDLWRICDVAQLMRANHIKIRKDWPSIALGSMYGLFRRSEQHLKKAA